MHRVCKLLAGILTVACLATQAHGASLIFRGTFTQDDQVQLFPFQLATASPVTIQTYGYAGGAPAGGAVVSPGGFDPVFALFTAAGTLLGIGDDGAPGVDPVTGMAFDALLYTRLNAGSYFVALTQFDNYALGPTFANGFLESGSGNFTPALTGCAATRFCDITGAVRNGQFALAVVIPEPNNLAMVGLALAGLVAVRRKRHGLPFGSSRQTA